MSPHFPARYFSGGYPANQTRCAVGDHLVDAQDHLCIRRLIPGGGGVTETVYEGCVVCLSAKLMTPTPPNIAPMLRALRMARHVITQPVSEAEIEAAVAAIDAALKG